MEIVMSLLLMLGGVSVFMFGMKQMSTGLDKSAGKGIREQFKKIDKSNSVNYLIGIITTVLLQSSSATSIMTISLAHANIVNVKQGAGLILGAKVGTTLTAFMFAMSGLSTGGFSMSAVFSAVAFVGVMIIFTTDNEKLNNIAPFLIGFGMLFIGMEVMEIAIGGTDSVLSMELSKLFKYEIMKNPVLLVILGILFAGIIQSSTAATGVFIAFLSTGVIQSVDQSFFLVMGANIGTCSDGLMASITTNANGKRLALFHLLSSIFGAAMFMIILIMFRAPINNYFNLLFPNKPQFSLATFNLIYNTIYTLILLLVLDPVVNIVSRMVTDKEEKFKELTYIDDSFLKTPAVAIEASLKEIYDMALLAKVNLDKSFNSLINADMSESKEIANNEYRIDYLTGKLTNYLIKISSTANYIREEKLIGGLHHVINDIERIGDYAVLIIKETNSMKTNDLSFLEETKEELSSIYANIDTLFDYAYDAFTNHNISNFKAISDVHENIQTQISNTRETHVIRLGKGLYPADVSKSIYSVLFSLQRVSDHIVNIAFSNHSTIGSKKEAFKSVDISIK